MSFEAFLTQEQSRPRKARRRTAVLSLALHVAVPCGAVAYSFAHVDELSMPSGPVIMIRQVPPPAPPPAAARQRTVPRTRRRSELVQPDRTRVVQPPEKPDERDDSASDGPGVPGGLAGGAGQGPPPAPAGAATRFVPPTVATGHLAIDPQDHRYQARLPPALARAGMNIWVMLRVCVKPDGQVGEVTVLKAADPALDPNIVAAVKTWLYHPYTVDGRPVPFCTNVRYEISSPR